MDSPTSRASALSSGLETEMRQLKDHQQTREELLNRVHLLKTELQDWRYKMDAKVKNYKGELASLKETLASETDALRRELEESSARLKRQIATNRDERGTLTSGASRLHRVSDN